MNLYLQNITTDELVEKIMSIPDEGERAKIIERLKTVALERVAAQAAVDSKKAVIAKIAAVRETQGGSNALKLLDGTLRRGGCPPLDSLVGKAKHEIEAVFAASSFSTTDKMACKSTMHKLGMIPA